MNINQNINKLLYALKQKGQLYKINTFQFYSEKNDKYSTKYQVLKRELIEKDLDIDIVYKKDEELYISEDEIEYEEKYFIDYECYNKIDLLKYFMKEYKGMG